MTDELPPPDCPFTKRMLTLLAEDPAQNDLGADEKMFELLLDLECEADDAGAAETSLRVISQVRRMAGSHALQVQQLRVAKLRSATNPASARRPVRQRSW